LLAVCVIASFSFVASGVATAHPFEACTPGFWKTHPDAWPVSADTTFGDLGVTADVAEDVTLQEALGYGGGDGLAGATRILLRAAAASLLNAEAANFPDWITTEKIARWVDAALASGQRWRIINLANRLDTFNNTGDCASD